MVCDNMQKSVLRYENMQDSGVEWIGMVPKGWFQTKLKRIITSRDGGSWGSDPKGNTDDKICLRVADFDFSIGRFKEQSTEKFTVRNYTRTIIDRLCLEKGDILIEKSGGGALTPVGRCVIFDKNISALYANFLERIRVDKDKIVPEFAEYWLRAMYYRGATIAYIKQTTGIQNLDITGLLSSEYIVFPDVTSQRAIISFLNKAEVSLNQFIKDAKTSIDEYKVWKSSIIYEAVTKGLDPNVEMKDSGIEWIGKIPVAWSACALKRLTVKIGSGKTPLGGAETYISQGVLFLRSQNIYDTGLRLDNASYISPEVNESMGNTQVKCGDVLLNITGGSIGRCCVYDLNGVAANVNQHVCIIRTQYEVLRPQYLRYFWNSAAGPMIISHYQTGGNRPGLNFEQIGSVKIPLCDVAVQDSIVKYLDKKTRKIDELIQEKEDLITDLESYKKSLIYEVVTGKRKVV